MTTAGTYPQGKRTGVLNEALTMPEEAVAQSVLGEEKSLTRF